MKPQRQTHKPFSRTSMGSPCAALGAILLWLLCILRIVLCSNCSERPFQNKGRDWKDDFVDLGDFATCPACNPWEGEPWTSMINVVLRWGEVGSATFWMSGKRLVCLILGTCIFVSLRSHILTCLCMFVWCHALWKYFEKTAEVSAFASTYQAWHGLTSLKSGVMMCFMERAWYYVSYIPWYFQ